MSPELQSLKRLLQPVPEAILLAEVRDQRFECVLDADLRDVRFTCLIPSTADFARITALVRFMECPHQAKQAATQKDKP